MSDELQRLRTGGKAVVAESAARLHHTNIVPVYGIGKVGGVHFLAMLFIEGAPLSRAMETLRDSSSSACPAGDQTPSSSMIVPSA